MTSLKYQKFVCQPIENQPVEAVTGIGPVAMGHLNKTGIYTAVDLLRQFQKENFMFSLHQITGLNTHWQNQCYNGLQAWLYNNPKWGNFYETSNSAVFATKYYGVISDHHNVLRQA